MYGYPYGDEHQINLNWIIKQIIDLRKQLDPDYTAPSFDQIYPFSNTAQLNLDWILEELKNLKALIPTENEKINVTLEQIAGGAIAHRGYGYSVNIIAGICQNTIKAFQLAKDNGFVAVEMDVMRDINNNIVCFHDAEVSNLTSGSGYLKNLDYTTLFLKDGTGDITGEKMPLFEEACYWAASNDFILLVEIKTGANVNAAPLDDIINIANFYNTKIILNLQYNTALLKEANDKWPNIIKNTNSYATTTLTKTIIDNLKSQGYKNIMFYSVVAQNKDVVDYAFSNGFIVCQKINSPYSNVIQNPYTVTFSEGYRPNYNSELVFDSGEITPTLRNGFISPSPNYPFTIRRLGNKVTISGVISNSNFTALPVSSGTRLQICSIPLGFRPKHYTRSIISIGEAFTGLGILFINTSGYITLFRVDNNLTLEQLNSDIIQIFIEYDVENPT